MRTSERRGQAAIESAIGLFVFALVLAAIAGFAPVYLKNMVLQSEARCDAGLAALGAEDGTEDIGNAAAIASRAHPGIVPGESDAWDYPVANLPEESRFLDWRGDSVPGGRLLSGGRKKSFRFRMFAGGNMLVDDYGHLSEDVFMPAMGGVKVTGGGQ